ncbi:uncharacterized protein [Procambarus clarkii]|uniref:uncharacterized protein n=1 Tax=Procambarus clarkii TaxID=6728 RepID=UPI001E6713DC|nr:uncharacterized protein LOC123764657 [Procambarus clarkii]
MPHNTPGIGVLMPWHGAPVVKPVTLVDSQNNIVTGVIAFVLSSMVLAYMFLCCHIWGLHLRLFQLLRCTPSHDTSNERAVHRRSISLPVNMVHLRGGDAMGVLPTGGTTAPSVTPPPRYSDVVDPLPSYSCALRRAVTVVGQPLHCRITVWGSSDEILNNSVFVGDSSPHLDHNSPAVPLPYMACNHIPVHTPTSLSLPPCMYANCGYVRNLSDTRYPASGHSTQGSTTLATTIHPSRETPHTRTPVNNNATTESTNAGNSNIVRMMSNGSRYDSTRFQIHNEDKVHHSQSGDRPFQPASSKQLNREEQQQCLRLWVKGDEQSQEQLVYARRTSGDRFVAYWTPPHFDPHHALHFQVVVEGRPVDMAHVELLDLHGTRLALTPLTLLSPCHLSSSPNTLTATSNTTLPNTPEAGSATT